MQLSNNKKQYIARGTGTIRNNVSEVMTWMAEDSQLSVMKPKNGHIKVTNLIVPLFLISKYELFSQTRK